MSVVVDANLKSWVEIPVQSDFPIQNIPFGIFKTADRAPRMGVAIGNQVLDLAVLAELGFITISKVDLLPKIRLDEVFNQPYLNDFMALGKDITNGVRLRIIELLSEGNSELRDDLIARENVLLAQDAVEMMMPFKVGDYTDFYSSIEHATNVGIMFRGPENALMPNWKHIPVGYHGRASSIVVSGTDLHRPKGQTKADDADKPSYGPSKLMDFELEMGFVVNKPTALGESITTENAEDYIFGLVLFNDWSARDIQKWEYVPLGPFLGKNFGSSVSPWVVTLEALNYFRVDGPKQDPEVLPYLQYEGAKNFDINLEVDLVPENGNGKTISKSNFKYMYWNMAQQLAHQTVNGCNVNTGDLYASGTISGPTPDSYGSMLELTWRGSKPIEMPDGTTRKFINDNDTVVMRGFCEKDGLRIGFGSVSGKILPSK